MPILLTNATLATMIGGFGLVPRGAVACDGDRILWAGPADAVPAVHRHLPRHDLGGRLVTPALIDCHTHVVHAGHRAGEFAMRIAGVGYGDIARAGGGIQSTVAATRAASEDDLVASALPRIDRMIASGVGTVEIKSGYGLTVADEVKMLRAARRIGSLRPVTVRTTHLAAHAVPAEYAGMAETYIAEVAIPSLKAAHAGGLVDAVDAFCEGIAFSPAELEPLFYAAQRLGLPVKLHAEQLAETGGAALAARFGALSADHLEYLSPEGIAALAAAGVTAVILPGAFYTLRETTPPPIAALRAAGVPMAVATDCNPGSSPMTSLPLAMNMAATLFRMTPEEVLAGATVHAARALGLSDRGTIAPGKRADLAVWDAEDPAELSYRIADTALHARVHGGQLDA